MLKFILGFAVAFGLSVSAMAVDVEIVDNPEAEEGQGNAHVIAFDGKPEATVAIVGKILDCHKSFKPQEKEHMETLLEGQGGVSELKRKYESMKRTPASTELLTLSNRELNESFVHGKFKACLSK